MMKEIKKIELKRVIYVTGLMGLIIGFLYSIVFGVIISSLTGTEMSSILDIIYLTLAFGIGSALIWLVYALVYNYIIVPLIGGIKIDL